jgi:hypothetical protein
MANHSCRPSAAYRCEARQVQASSAGSSGLALCIVLYALQGGLKAGEELLLSYLDPAASREDRRERLLQGYGFACTCSKCEEEVEEGAQPEQEQQQQPAEGP